MDKCSGVFHDLTIAVIGFFSLLDPDEKVFADKTYIGDSLFFYSNKEKIYPLKNRPSILIWVLCMENVFDQFLKI